MLIELDYPVINLSEFTKPTILKFTADFCSPCKVLTPILEDLSIEFLKVQFFEVDIYKYVDLAKLLNIKAVPTLIFLKGGAEVSRIVGLTSKNEIIRKIANNS